MAYQRTEVGGYQRNVNRESIPAFIEIAFEKPDYSLAAIGAHLPTARLAIQAHHMNRRIRAHGL
ncbi:hypothetical protein D3C72_2464370 [compost metagenome]